MFDNRVTVMRDRLAGVQVTSLGQTELQAAILATRELAAAVALLGARLAGELTDRGAAIVTDATGVEVEIEAQAWLGGTLHADRRTVRFVLRRGYRLTVLDSTRDALAAGDITVEQADAITVIHGTIPEPEQPEAERVLLRAARRGATPVDLAMLRQQIQHRLDPDGSTIAEQARFDARALTLTEFGDGSLRVTGKLDPVAGAQVLQCLRAYAGKQGDTDTRTPGQRMTDALHHVCTTHIDDPTTQRRRPEIIALVPLAALLGDRTAPLGRLADSTALLSHEAAQALACTGGLRRLVTDSNQTDRDQTDSDQTGWDAGLAGLLPARLQGPPVILDLGRARRLATNDQWAALLVRDGGCTYPGCTAPPSMTEIHHLREWTADHGPTDLDHPALLCRWHHHDLHTRKQHLARNHHTGQSSVLSPEPSLAAA